MKPVRRLLPLAIAAAVAVTISTPVGAATSAPSGERHLGQATLEPAYDAAHPGELTYLLTPDKAPNPVKANPHAWAPIYIPVYPIGSTAATTFNCQHMPVENCPDHGGLVASAAQAILPDVYGAGVAGHDHVLDVPGGDDFNIAWEPVLVLFTSAATANQHLLIDDAILAAAARGDVLLVPAPQLTFDCSVVSVAAWTKATPVV
jgi:hypothetical protein